MTNVPMTRPNELLAMHEQNYGHSVSFVGLEGGRILEGTGAEFIYSDDGGITWSEPYPGLDHTGEPLPASCTSLVNLSGDAIGIATLQYLPGSTSSHDTQMVFRTSEDQGHTWSPPVIHFRSHHPAGLFQRRPGLLARRGQTLRGRLSQREFCLH